GDDPRKAPIYHGAVALLKAVSYLETRAEVDKHRIGMAGSSWGGFFTTLMIGIGPPLKAGSSLYGTRDPQLVNAWWGGQSEEGRDSARARGAGAVADDARPGVASADEEDADRVDHRHERRFLPAVEHHEIVRDDRGTEASHADSKLGPRAPSENAGGTFLRVA